MLAGNARGSAHPTHQRNAKISRAAVKIKFWLQCVCSGCTDFQMADFVSCGGRDELERRRPIRTADGRP